MGSAVNIAIPAIGTQFHSTTFLLSWVMTSYLLSCAALLLPFGKLADLTGRRRIFNWGLLVFTISSLLCCLAWSIEALIFFRIIQGIGSAAMFSTGMAILTLAFPPENRGKILGLNAATVYVGLSLGPVIGGILNQQIGWQSIFILFAILGTPVTILAFKKLQTDPVETAKDDRFDLLSAGFYCIGLSLLLYGITAATSTTVGPYATVLGAGLLFLFMRRQFSIPQPLFNTKLFLSNTAFALANLAALINYSATFAIGFILSIHLHVIMGFDSQTAGLILIINPVMMALLSPFAGNLSDRIAPRIVASWGMALTALGLALLTFLTESSSVLFLGFLLALIGVGFALFSSPNNNAVMGAVARQHYGIAGSTLGTMRLVGQALSMALATLIIHYYTGETLLELADKGQLLQSFHTTFFILAAACFLGIFASAAKGRNSVDS
jgi:EmrB/QacA subfamily drug resistance transporter